eukprot:9774162-Alexandrium_andersonii.AAC.1
MKGLFVSCRRRALRGNCGRNANLLRTPHTAIQKLRSKQAAMPACRKLHFKQPAIRNAGSAAIRN